MKSHSEKYFTEALQICAFFKYNTNPWEEQISEAIKLMTIDELYANIANTQYETKLIKEMIIFLIEKVEQPKFTKNGGGSAIHYLQETLRGHRKQIIENYYLQLALQQYFFITSREQNRTGYEKVFNFCQLQIQLKFNLLCTLIENVLMYAYPSASKIKKQQLNQTKNSQNIGKKSKKAPQQILILGEDNKFVYFFASFQPTYVFTLYMNKWQIHTKNDVKQRIKSILKQPQNPNMLFLAENLAKIYTSYIEEPKTTIPHIRLHKATPSHDQRKRVEILKQKLLEINYKYNFYLSNFSNRCWGYLPFRQNYEKKLKTAQTLTQLIEALKQFFLVSHSKIYVIKGTDDESKIRQQQYTKYYSAQTRPYCNINTVSVKITPLLFVQSEEISKKMLQQNRADMFALLQINVMILGIAVKMLDKKAKKYFQKVKKKQSSLHSSKAESNQIKNESDNNGNNGKKRILRDRPLKSEVSQLSSIQDSETSNSMKTAGMNLRQRKKKSNVFGVKMIDSDQSDQSEDQSKKTHQLNKYEYKTRSVANK